MVTNPHASLHSIWFYFYFLESTVRGGSAAFTFILILSELLHTASTHSLDFAPVAVMGGCVVSISWIV